MTTTTTPAAASDPVREMEAIADSTRAAQDTKLEEDPKRAVALLRKVVANRDELMGQLMTARADLARVTEELREMTSQKHEAEDWLIEKQGKITRLRTALDGARESMTILRSSVPPSSVCLGVFEGSFACIDKLVDDALADHGAERQDRDVMLEGRDELIDELTRERDEARDCGQGGICATPPGCQRHWHERNRELVCERDEARTNFENACRTVASMHAATVGEVTGPRLGVVEDVANLRQQPAERDAEIERLRKMWTGTHDALMARGADVRDLQRRLDAMTEAVEQAQFHLHINRPFWNGPQHVASNYLTAALAPPADAAEEDECWPGECSLPLGHWGKHEAKEPNESHETHAGIDRRESRHALVGEVHLPSRPGLNPGGSHHQSPPDDEALRAELADKDAEIRMLRITAEQAGTLALLAHNPAALKQELADASEQLQRLVRELAEERARGDKAIELLAECQWADVTDYGNTSCCTSCGRRYRQGHSDDCDIKAALTTHAARRKGEK